MSEREVVSVVSAVSPVKVPGLHKGEQSDRVNLVTYSDGTLAYACSICNKEYEKFGSVWAHYPHHNRDKASYQHAARNNGGYNKKDPLQSMQRLIKNSLDEYIIDISNDLAAVLVGSSESATVKLQQEIDDLRVKHAQERALRIKAEKDLAKIRNLFK
jgi:hypothetical protein